GKYGRPAGRPGAGRCLGGRRPRPAAPPWRPSGAPCAPGPHRRGRRCAAAAAPRRRRGPAPARSRPPATSRAGRATRAHACTPPGGRGPERGAAVRECRSSPLLRGGVEQKTAQGLRGQQVRFGDLYPPPPGITRLRDRVETRERGPVRGVVEEQMPLAGEAVELAL